MAVYSFDTNILAYAIGIGASDADAAKADMADELLTETLLSELVVLPAQVCLELHNLLVKKGRLSQDQATRLVREYSDGVELIASDREVVQAAFDLSHRHRLQTYDAVILASAAHGGCDILYSEDMQDGFEWQGVRVVNPFA